MNGESIKSSITISSMLWTQCYNESWTFWCYGLQDLIVTGTFLLAVLTTCEDLIFMMRL